MIIRIKYILPLLLLITNIAFAQNSISVSAKQDTILIGDHLIVDVVLRADNVADLVSIDFTEWRELFNLAYQNDTINLEKNTAATIIGKNEWGISDQYFSTPVEAMEGWFQNGNTISKQIKISIYEYGVWVLPAPKIVNKSGERYPVLEPERIFVLPADLGMAQDSIQLMPIKDIITEGESWEDYKIWFYILGFILLAPLLIKLFWGRKKEEEEVVEEEVFIPAHKKALSALQSLQRKELWQSGNIKAYQSELTDIVRRYLGDRFDINALEMTTDEINRALRDKDFDTKHSTTLQRILTIADLVKFAKATPPVEINAEFMDEAVAFVESTKKEEVENFTLTENSNEKNTVEKVKSRSLKSKIYHYVDLGKTILFGVFLVVIGIQFANDGIDKSNSKRKKELVQLIENGLTTTTRLDKKYKEKTVKIGKIKTITNEFTYGFQIDNSSYSGTTDYTEIPADFNVSVTYLESDPSINSIDPIKELEKYSTKNKWTSIVLGIAAFLFGLFILYRFYKRIKKHNSN